MSIIIKKQILEKQRKVDHIRENLNRSSAVIFYNFSHTDNNEVFLLKRKLKEVSGEWFVCKNTLFGRALSNKSFQISNNNAFVFCKGDQYEPLKVLKNFNFRKDLTERIQGGVYNGDFIDHQTLVKWANLKSRKVLLGDLCKFLVFDIVNLTMLLNAIASK